MEEPNNQELIIEDTEKFKKALKMSNTVEIVAGIFVLMTFLPMAYFFRDKPISLPIGCLLSACGALFIILFILRKRVRKGEIPAKEDLLNYLRYWAGWYGNTYQLARNIFWWYLLPLIPGFVFFTFGFMQLIPDKSTFTLIVVGSTFATVFGIVFWLNRFVATKKLQTKIDSLNSWITKLESSGS